LNTKNGLVVKETFKFDKLYSAGSGSASDRSSLYVEHAEHAGLPEPPFGIIVGVGWIVIVFLNIKLLITYFGIIVGCIVIVFLKH
jgi:hypothetical protein